MRVGFPFVVVVIPISYPSTLNQEKNICQELHDKNEHSNNENANEPVELMEDSVDD